MTAKKSCKNILVTRSAIVMVALTTCFAMQNAWAIPESVDAGQTGKRINKIVNFNKKQSVGLPNFDAAAEITPEQKAQMEKITFTLKEVVIEGATIYTNEQLSELYQGLIGTKISFYDAQMIAKSITDKYRNDGYILSQAVVPQQDVTAGKLKIIIVEGFVNGVIFEGQNISESEKEILLDHANKITSSKPVRIQDLERYLLLMNDLAGAQVRGTLRASADQFGAADLVLSAEHKAFEGSYSIDNRGSKYIGPVQHTGILAANSAFGWYDRTQLSLMTTSPTTELRSFQIQHDEMLDAEGTKLSLTGGRTHTNPGDSLKTNDIIGDSDLFQIKLSHPFIRARQENLVGRISFDYRNTDTNINHDTDFTEDRLRTLRIGGNYSFFDSWAGNNTIDFEASQGFNIFNASEDGTDRSNSIAESDYTKLNLDLSRTQGLFDNFSLFAAATAQYSFDPLLVAEQFSLGGMDFGTAYDPAEVLGDTGIAGKLELRYGEALGGDYFTDYQLYSYYDIGRAWLKNVPASTNEKRSLSSAGIGLRTNLIENLYGNVEVALPLTKPASNQGSHGEDPRLFFGLTARF